MSLGLLQYHPLKQGRKPGITNVRVLGEAIEDEEYWVFPRSKPDHNTKRKIFAKCVSVGINALFKMHTYKFNGQYFLQVNGAPIGLSCSGDVGKIKMGATTRMFHQVLMDNSIKVFLSFLYVDDW